MPDNALDILLNIRANTDQLVAGLNKGKKAIQDAESTTKGFSSAFNMMKGAVTAAVGSMVATIVKDFMVLGGQVDTVAKTFDRLAAGASGGAKGLLTAMTTATEGTVAQLDIMKSSNLAVQLMGEDVIKNLPEMAKIAKAAARAQGKDVAQMLEDIVVASGRRSVMILDNLGISSAVAAKYQEEYAKSLGKTRETLNDTQKSQAFFYAVMKAGGEVYDRAGSGALTFGEKLQIMNAQFQDMKNTLSRELIPAWENLMSEFSSVGSSIDINIKDIGRAVASLIVVFKALAKTALTPFQIVGEVISGAWFKSLKSARDFEAYMGKMSDRYAGIGKDFQAAYNIWNKAEEDNSDLIVKEQKKKQDSVNATKKELLKLSEYYKYLGQSINEVAVKEGDYIKDLQKKHIISARQLYEMRMVALDKWVEGRIKLEGELEDYLGDKNQAEINAEFLKYQEISRIYKDDAERKAKIDEEYRIRKTLQDIQSTEFTKRLQEGVSSYTKEALTSIDNANRQLIYNLMWGKGGWNEFKKALKDIFKQLLADITYAIIRAAALQAILSATGLGGAGLISRLIFEKGFVPSHETGYLPKIPAYPSGYVPADHHLAYISDSEAIINKASTQANYDALRWMNEHPGQSMGGGGSHVANINVVLDGRVVGRAVDVYREDVSRNSSLQNYGRKGAYKS